ncbi:hypothetical protein [Amycolatopsis thailandensis]|uniref:hypothetical protein n=1 Tax=Amycolatopsis thailandensis TaxID=589330 RepID=UPI003626356B
MNQNIEDLVAGFAGWVEAFEARQGFAGPSRYFHDKAIELRRGYREASALLADVRFLEYVYAVLPSWGMHRMGPQKAKVAEFGEIVAALRQSEAEIVELWPFDITTLSEPDAMRAAELAWCVIERVRVSRSGTQIVAGSKFLHHLLPDLIPPIDRAHTFRFFTGSGYVRSDRHSFLEWLPRFASIGRRCAEPIIDVMAAPVGTRFMGTGKAKVIDNAIISFMQGRV